MQIEINSQNLEKIRKKILSGEISAIDGYLLIFGLITLVVSTIVVLATFVGLVIYAVAESFELVSSINYQWWLAKFIFPFYVLKIFVGEICRRTINKFI